jgi:hypothetical protein
MTVPMTEIVLANLLSRNVLILVPAVVCMADLPCVVDKQSIGWLDISLELEFIQFMYTRKPLQSFSAVHCPALSSPDVIRDTPFN